MRHEYFEFLNKTVKHGQGDSDKHLLTLYSIALQISAKSILELGVRSGLTTLPLICAAAENAGTVLQDVASFPDNRFDLVYIDDWHSYDHVKMELEIINKLVTPSSIILLHDLMYSNAQPDYRSDVNTADPEWLNGGPYRAVAELDKDIWEWSTIPVNHGLTILRKKSGKIIA